jgi:acyl carrier protein
VIVAVFGVYLFASRSAPAPTTTVFAPPPEATMTRLQEEPVDRRVIQVLSRLTGVPAERITPETSLADDLKAGDLEPADLVLEVEEDLGIAIPDEEADRIRTVGELIKAAEDRVHRGTTPAGHEEHGHEAIPGPPFAPAPPPAPAPPGHDHDHGEPHGASRLPAIGPDLTDMVSTGVLSGVRAFPPALA